MNNRAVYTRENKPRLTLTAAYIIRESNYLYEYKLQGQDKPRLEKAVNVDFVPFIRGIRVLCKPRLIFSRINGPNELVPCFIRKGFWDRQGAKIASCCKKMYGGKSFDVPKNDFGERSTVFLTQFYVKSIWAMLTRSKRKFLFE